MNARSGLARPGGLFALLLTTACAWTLGGCAAESNTGTGGFTGSGGTAVEDGGTPGTGGLNGNGGSRGAGGATSTGGARGAGGATGTGGATGAGGATATGGARGTGASSGSGGSPGTGGASTGTGGASSGTGGASTGTGGASSGAGGSHAGSGGSSARGGATGTGGLTGVGGAAGASSGAGGNPTGGGASFCPSGAIFCADFEEASGVPSNAPVGTAAFSDPSEYGATFGGASNAVMVLDATAPYAGTQSLKINPSSGFSVRTLAVPVPQTFWVRLYIKSDKAIGQPDHNSFFGAGIDPSYSKGKFVEVSEQFSCILLNQSDTLFPTGTTCGANSALTADEWHCMAAQFDGATGNVQVYAGTTKIIDAAGWAPAKQAFTTFSFGYFAYNANSATVWYDNVVVSPNPLSCP